MLNNNITLHFVPCAASLKNLAEGLHHYISIRVPCYPTNQNLLLRPARARQQRQQGGDRLHLVKQMS